MKSIKLTQIVTVLAIIFVVLVTHVNAQNMDETSGPDGVNGRQKAPNSVCEKSGCECDSQVYSEATRVDCDCKISVGGSVQLFRIKSALPKKLNSFTLRNCDKVVLEKNLFANHNMAVFTIEDCEELSIEDGSIKSVKDLRLKNVAKFVLNHKALSQLRAETIEFDNVTIASPSYTDHVHAEIHPEKVTSRFVFKDSVLQNGTGLNIQSGERNDQLVVGFYNCDLEKPETFNVTCNKFEMVGNRFTELWNESLVSTVYKDRLILNSNTLNGNPLLDISIGTTDDAGVEIFVNTTNITKSNATISRHWFQYLRFDYDGNISKDASHANCHENSQKQLNERKITCPNKQSLQTFFKSQFFQLFMHNINSSQAESANQPAVSIRPINVHSGSAVLQSTGFGFLILMLFVFKTIC